ncbi:hypothetical protein PP641_gp044 [Arthrobacter phage SilentRX]|uniref:Lipoprotein n=1 Tax=Arthrobacter phage SilentRX TaxID=2836091 RepID=A0A8F3EBK2_9CAUD|nr:hypothetical protein PP641_gp044 [Arthrobacter phage SilentRX]QWY82784.1 hypothetical protein SEA_SILENTRX_44 [Arthrobacter phage SilentRX]
MKRTAKITLALAIASALALTGCNPTQTEREKAQSQSQIKDSLEKKNLERKRDREENPTAERYLYLMNYGQIIGYYVTKGKVSSNSSQIGPELMTMSGYRDSSVVDSAKDDGTYGSGDPGIFFFTSDDVMVETSLDYIMSDAPLAIDVPRLRK